MPNITKRTYRQKRPKKELGYKKSKDYQPYYGSKQWKILREWKKTQSPLCEACLLQSKFVPMDEVHHLRTFMSGSTREEKWDIFTNPDGLASLCNYHHKLIHKYMQKLNTNYLSLEQLIAYEEQETLSKTNNDN